MNSLFHTPTAADKTAQKGDGKSAATTTRSDVNNNKSVILLYNLELLPSRRGFIQGSKYLPCSYPSSIPSLAEPLNLNYIIAAVVTKFPSTRQRVMCHAYFVHSFIHFPLVPPSLLFVLKRPTSLSEVISWLGLLVRALVAAAAVACTCLSPFANVLIGNGNAQRGVTRLTNLSKGTDRQRRRRSCLTFSFHSFIQRVIVVVVVNHPANSDYVHHAGSGGAGAEWNDDHEDWNK